MQEIFAKIAHRFYQDFSAKTHYPIPPLELIQTSGSLDIAHYFDNMLIYTKDIIQQCMLKRNSRVLDIGCGAGRIAGGLVNYLDVEGSYVGMDVNDAVVSWCRQNISVRNANFLFHKIPVVNNYYYHGDNQQKNIYDFDFLEERKFDCIIALSTFNHLRLEDTVQYLQEVGKRLDKNGVAYLTFNVIDEEFFSFQKLTKQHLNLGNTEEGIWYAYERKDFFAGYDPSLLEEVFSSANLTVLDSSSGSWAQKKNARIYQDWYLVTVEK